MSSISNTLALKLAALTLFSAFSAVTAGASDLPVSAAAPLVGTYSRPHQIGFLSYADQASCEGDQGKWEGDVCMMDASDDVTVSQQAGKFTLAVSTVTTNAHMCDFAEPARALSTNVIVARQKNDEGLCTVTATFAKDHMSVSISTKGSCRYDCGMNASLDIEKADRK